MCGNTVTLATRVFDVNSVFHNPEENVLYKTSLLISESVGVANDLSRASGVKIASESQKMDAKPIVHQDAAFLTVLDKLDFLKKVSI